jgi:CubicO group peptidase (beta-lactamase class C family)
MKLFLLFLALIVASPSVVLSQTTNQSSVTKNAPKDKIAVNLNSQEIKDRVDDFLTAAGATGGVLIAKDGKVILRKGYGWADESRKIPMTTRTVFDIASITKQFTGAAILKLEEQGKLKVTDSITKFFKDVPADKQNITVHQLLTHTAGFEHEAVKPGEHPTRDEAVSKMLNSKLKLKPGEKYSYANMGYVLLAVIVEIASGMPYENYLYENLWKPAGMIKTGNVIPRFTQDEMARGYDVSEKLSSLQGEWDKDGIHWSFRGAGGLLSTLEDFYLWHLALEGEKILSKESKLKYFTPHVPEDEGTVHYGYGWAISQTACKTRLIGHNGGNNIFFANFRRYVDENVVILYFTNESRAVSRPILNSVPKAVFDEQMPSFPRPKATLTRSELQKYVGAYELPSGDRFTLDVLNNRLAIKASSPGISKLLIFPQLEDPERLGDLETRTAKLIESLASKDFEPIREMLDLEGTLEEEKTYWKRTFAEWTKRFGKFKKSEVVGSVKDKEFLNTYVLLKFERGARLVTYRQNEKKQFYIGKQTSVFPQYYSFIPQSKTEFIVYNYALKTTTPVNFNFGEKNVVTGLTIENEQGKINARKILPAQEKESFSPPKANE